jgi:hypothetical protein
MTRVQTGLQHDYGLSLYIYASSDSHSKFLFSKPIKSNFDDHNLPSANNTFWDLWFLYCTCSLTYTYHRIIIIYRETGYIYYIYSILCRLTDTSEYRYVAMKLYISTHQHIVLDSFMVKTYKKTAPYAVLWGLRRPWHMQVCHLKKEL